MFNCSGMRYHHVFNMPVGTPVDDPAGKNVLQNFKHEDVRKVWVQPSIWSILSVGDHETGRPEGKNDLSTSGSFIFGNEVCDRSQQ
jgi:hypothetical protein